MTHLEEAQRALEQADHIRNSDHWPGDRDAPSRHFVAVAQVHATLAVAEELQHVAKATYTAGGV